MRRVERHVERRTSLGDLSFRRLGLLLRVLLPDGSDLGVDAGVAISLGHCELCLSYSRRSGPVVFHAVAPTWSERVAITVMIPSSTRSELEGRRPGCVRPCLLYTSPSPRD